MGEILSRIFFHISFRACDLTRINNIQSFASPDWEGPRPVCLLSTSTIGPERYSSLCRGPIVETDGAKHCRHPIMPHGWALGKG